MTVGNKFSLTEEAKWFLEGPLKTTRTQYIVLPLQNKWPRKKIGSILEDASGNDKYHAT